MIIRELTAEFNEYFQSPNAELILWLNPEREWRGIIEHLRNDFRVVEFNGSQLQVKAEVELTWAKGERPKFVLYLPGLSREKLTVLKEYEFSGKVFEDSILQAFTRWGVEFERQHEAELEKILPFAISRFAAKSRSFWKDRLTPTNVRSLLFDDESVRKMLAAPEATAREFKATESYEIFCDYMEDRFGGPRLRDYEPTTWAQRFTAYLMLTEVRAGVGKLSSFPKFDVGWADERRESQCLAFIRDWLQNATYKEDYKRLAREVERVYDLTAWASSLQEPKDCEASLTVERVFEKGIFSQLSNLQDISALRGFLSAKSDIVREMARHFWSREGEIVAWRALILFKQIVEATEHCSRELENINSAGELAEKYAYSWWSIDRDYRKFRGQFDGEGRVSGLARQISVIYRDFQNNLNEKFMNLLVSQGSLDVQKIEPQSSFWEKNVGASKRKRAVFLVDALRFELACELAERLSQEVPEAKVKCKPLMAAVPTLTPVGMASILPLEGIHIAVSDGNWDVRDETRGESGNLAVMEERKKLIKKRHPKAVFHDLDDILKPSQLDFGTGNPIIVFSREMDGLGHESGALNLSLDYLGQYIDGLLRAIRRLASAGIEEIHLVSDHGFIICDDIGEADKVSIDKEAEICYQGHRCLVGRNLPERQGLQFDLPNSDGLKFVVPWGTGIFRARGSNEFFHGGLSLQELLVPHIEAVFAKAQPKYGAKLKAPEAIHNLIFEVELLRAIPAAGVLFGAPRFVEVVGFLLEERGAREILRQSGGDLVIDQAHETLGIRLRIRPGTRFRYGDVLRLELRDADTAESLDTVEIRIEVESDDYPRI